MTFTTILTAALSGLAATHPHLLGAALLAIGLCRLATWFLKTDQGQALSAYVALRLIGHDVDDAKRGARTHGFPHIDWAEIEGSAEGKTKPPQRALGAAKGARPAPHRRAKHRRRGGSPT